MKKTKILIVAAHPDDEILGCGGTVARLTREGDEAFTLILGEGITSRDENRKIQKKRIGALKKQIIEANKIIGVKKIFTYEFPDNRFDTIPLLDIIKVIEKIKKVIKPNIIFTHYEKDLNIDHRLTYKAVITATRPLLSETVKEIYSFEIPSSTEWNCPLNFSPDVFFDITDFLKFKLTAMERYKLEIRQFPHPRSTDGLKLNAQYWGMRVGLRYAEVFQSIRIIK